jgi:hypothetical protein
MSVDTAKVQGRRKVAYTSLGEVLADAEHLSAGEIKALGNWTPGQVFAHLARTFNGSIDGLGFHVPWYFRLMGRVMKKQMLKGDMPPGFRLPADAAVQLVPGPTSVDEGLAALRAAIERQEREPNRVLNPVLGALTREEWIQLHLKHAALHMSFLAPAG